MPQESAIDFIDTQDLIALEEWNNQSASQQAYVLPEDDPRWFETNPRSEEKLTSVQDDDLDMSSQDSNLKDEQALQLYDSLFAQVSERGLLIGFTELEQFDRAVLDFAKDQGFSQEDIYRVAQVCPYPEQVKGYDPEAAAKFFSDYLPSGQSQSKIPDMFPEELSPSVSEPSIPQGLDESLNPFEHIEQSQPHYSVLEDSPTRVIYSSGNLESQSFNPGRQELRAAAVAEYVRDYSLNGHDSLRGGKLSDANVVIGVVRYPNIKNSLDPSPVLDARRFALTTKFKNLWKDLNKESLLVQSQYRKGEVSHTFTTARGQHLQYDYTATQVNDLTTGNYVLNVKYSPAQAEQSKEKQEPLTYQMIGKIEDLKNSSPIDKFFEHVATQKYPHLKAPSGKLELTI